MNKFFASTLTAVALLLSFSGAQARLFEVIPKETFHEIVDDRYGIIKYEVLQTAPVDVEAQVHLIQGKEVIPGVEQLCASEEYCVQSCGEQQVNVNAPGICQDSTELGDDVSCELQLCVDGSRVTDHHIEQCKDGNTSGCAPKICSDRDVLSSCDSPLPENALNIETISNHHALPISTIKPGHAFPPFNHFAVLKCGVSYEFEIRNDSSHSTAYQVAPFFNQTTLEQLELYPNGLPYDASDCATVGYGETCSIEITPKQNASMFFPQHLHFEGTNTKQSSAKIAIQCDSGSLDLVIEHGGIGFDEPGIKSLNVRNTTDETIRIYDVR